MINLKFMKKHLSIVSILSLICLLVLLLYIKVWNKNKLLISENSALSEENRLLALNLAPECTGRCPVYSTYDTDNDGVYESIVEVPTTMNRGAGEIWIIDKGKVVFKNNGGANVGFQVPGYGNMEDDKGGGIFISYTNSWDETGLYATSGISEEWRYENGNYVLKNTTTNEYELPEEYYTWLKKIKENN